MRGEHSGVLPDRKAVEKTPVPQSTFLEKLVGYDAETPTLVANTSNLATGRSQHRKARAPSGLQREPLL